MTMTMISLFRYGKLCSGFLQRTTHQGITNRSFRYFHATSLPMDGCSLPFDIGPYSAAEVKISTNNDKDDDNNDDDDEVLLSKIQESIQFWKDNDYTSAWITVPSTRARLVETLSSKDNTNLCFDLHHINSSEQTIIMKKWLKDDIEDKIPPWASHQVGVAGFVLNDDNEILLIKEWSGPLSSRVPSKQWKMPGGMLDKGESFEEATIREVYEETGIECSFEGILSFWHRHNLKWGKSDLYYVCLLRPKSLELNICPVEISDATWMHVNDFLANENHPLITEVMRNNFSLDVTSNVNENAERLKPLAYMKPGSVQWPGREPYPTYYSVPTK